MRAGQIGCAACSFKLYNIRQNWVFYYLGATSQTGKSPVSGFNILTGKQLGQPVTITQTNPYEPTQASCLALHSPCMALWTATWKSPDNLKLGPPLSLQDFASRVPQIAGPSSFSYAI